MEQGDQIGAEQLDIKGDKLDLHVQEIFGKREVTRSKRYGIPKFSKGAEKILGTGERRHV